MIRKIELWDWECFEHCVIEDLHGGLNLIFGESDSGKTSVVRAVRLVAYNDFDPRSVRTGKKNAKVYVETERGWVKVTRGKDNIWEVCRAGGAPGTFSKIGKNILPEAAEVLGLHVVKLGDMELPVNVMDQGESHFMLNELGGENASGSMRAQIVDEISGLSGIEGLIKEVSLDRHRFSRAVKENEDRAAELRATMHDEKAIEEEAGLLSEARALVDFSDEAVAAVEDMAELFEAHHGAQEEAGRLSSELASMPNTKILGALLSRGRKVLGRADALRAVRREHEAQSEDLAEASKRLVGMPDPEEAALVLRAARESASRSRELAALELEHSRLKEELGRCEGQFGAIPDVGAAARAAEDCRKRLSRARRASEAAYELAAALEAQDEAEDALSRCEGELASAEDERAEALLDVDLCPLTGRQVSKECFEGVKFPVRS